MMWIMCESWESLARLKNSNCTVQHRENCTVGWDLRTYYQNVKQRRPLLSICLLIRKFFCRSLPQDLSVIISHFKCRLPTHLLKSNMELKKVLETNITFFNLYIKSSLNVTTRPLVIAGIPSIAKRIFMLRQTWELLSLHICWILIVSQIIVGNRANMIPKGWQKGKQDSNGKITIFIKILTFSSLPELKKTTPITNFSGTGVRWFWFWSTMSLRTGAHLHAW